MELRVLKLFPSFVVVLPFIFSIANAQKFTIVPASKIVKVNEGKLFDVYYEMKPELKNSNHTVTCYYSSGNISGSYSFKLTPPDPLEIFYPAVKGIEPQNIEHKFRPFNKRKVCGFSISDTDFQVPKIWNLTVHDENEGETYSEIITVQFYYKAKMLKDTTTIFEGSSSINYIENVHNRTWERCKILDKNDENIEFDLSKPDTEVPPGASFKSKISGLAHGKCGFHLTNAHRDDSGELTIIAQDNENQTYRVYFKLNVMSKGEVSKDHRNEMEVILGDSATDIKCGQSETHEGTQLFCYLFNPSNDLVVNGRLCNHRLAVVRQKDLGQWKCKIGHRYKMDAVDLSTNVKEKEKSLQHSNSWSKDEGDIHSIGCKVNTGILGLAYCKFVRPDGKIFIIETSSSTDRYTTMGTNLLEGICAIEIWKPLTPEEEGTWRCEAHDTVTGNGFTGTYIDVVKKSAPISYLVPTRRDVNLGESFLIECSIPRPAHHCYILSPNGTYYKSDHPDKIPLGDCVLLVENISERDIGNWTCFFSNGEIGRADEKVTVEISLTSRRIFYADAEITEGNVVNLVCNTDEVPLQQCIFVSPQGNSYNLRSSSKQTNRMSYHGRGLNYGDCGIKIQNTVQSDEGKWICHLETRKTHVRQEINLSVAASGMGLAGSLGIAIGSIVAVLVVAGFGYFTYYLNKKKRDDNVALQVRYEQSRTSNESEEGRRSVILPTGSSQTEPNVVYNSIN